MRVVILDKCCSRMTPGGYISEMLAAALTGGASIEQLINFINDPNEKSLILTTMVTQVKERQTLISLARILNFKPEFPHHLVNDTLERLGN